MSKYPQCECKTTRFSYFRRRYRNGSLHLLRKCEACGKTGQNAMTQADYDANWVDTLPIVEPDGTGHSVKPNLQSRADVVKSRANPVQSRADAIHEKLQRHIQKRNTHKEQTHANR